MGMSGPFSAEQVAQYQRDGYLIVRQLYDAGEMQSLLSFARQDPALAASAYGRKDATGQETKLALWNHPTEDLYGLFSRSPRLVDRAEQLLSGEVYHWHTKMMLKEPYVGGAWEWHQDYGYWYKNQFMFPDQLISVMVALTEANKQNGCLQLIEGSHKLGRVNHGFAGEQVGADMVMVNNALQTMRLVYCEIQPGDALIFHPNLLHRSEANLSDKPRWSVISCYNSQSNLAYNETSTAWKVPVEIVPDSAILEWEAESLSNADFLKKENDPALKETGWEKEVATKK